MKSPTAAIILAALVLQGLQPGPQLIGYFFKKYEFSAASLVLGLVLGRMMEETFRRALLLSHGYMSAYL